MVLLVAVDGPYQSTGRGELLEMGHTNQQGGGRSYWRWAIPINRGGGATGDGPYQSTGGRSYWRWAIPINRGGGATGDGPYQSTGGELLEMGHTNQQGGGGLLEMGHTNQQGGGSYWRWAIPINRVGGATGDGPYQSTGRRGSYWRWAIPINRVGRSYWRWAIPINRAAGGATGDGPYQSTGWGGATGDGFCSPPGESICSVTSWNILGKILGFYELLGTLQSACLFNVVNRSGRFARYWNLSCYTFNIHTPRSKGIEPTVAFILILDRKE